MFTKLGPTKSSLWGTLPLNLAGVSLEVFDKSWLFSWLTRFSTLELWGRVVDEGLSYGSVFVDTTGTIFCYRLLLFFIMIEF